MMNQKSVMQEEAQDTGQDVGAPKQKIQAGIWRDFFGKVIVSSFLWISVATGLMLFPILAVKSGAIKEFPAHATNISVFYDEHLAWSIFGGGIFMLVVFSFVNTIYERFSKKARRPGDESVLTMAMGELASQFIGFATLLAVSSVYYWFDKNWGNGVFKPTASGEYLLIPALAMVLFALLVYWLAYGEKNK
jgi:hypothetical protein